MTEENQASSDRDRMKDLEEERIRQRLLSLERHSEKAGSRERVFGLGLLVALVLAAIAAFSPHLLAVGGDVVELQEISVERLVLKDAEGVVRGGWNVDGEGNSRLTLRDRQGRTRLSLSVRNNGSPGLSLRNANGVVRAGLALQLDETTNLVFADGAGVVRTIVGLSRADAAHLLFADADGETQIFIGLDGAGEASVILPEASQDEETPEGGG